MISVASGLYFSISSSSLIRRTVGYWEREWGSGGVGEQGREGVTQKYSNFMKLHTNVCVRVGGCCSGGLLLLAGSY